MRDNRVVVLFDDFEIAELLIRAGEVPLSKWIRKRVLDIPRREELAAGEASAPSNDASGEVASRRLPKAAKPQKSISVELPDTTLCQHNMFKGACPRCSSRI